MGGELTPAPATEPGYTTTEFWATEITSGITLAGALAADFGLGSLNATQRTDITLAAIFLVGLVQAVYTVARTLRKNKSG